MAARLNSPLVILANVSLRRPLRELVRLLELPPARLSFGLSGPVLGQIEAGSDADLLLSDDVANSRVRGLRPDADVVVIALNSLVAVARRDVGLSSENLLDRMLDASVRLGIGAPGRDASGEAAAKMFDRAEAIRPGAGARLRDKAILVVNRSDQAELDLSTEAIMESLDSGSTDILLALRTQARSLTDIMQVVVLPHDLAVPVEVGIVMLAEAGSRRQAALAVVEGLLSPAAQEVLLRHGFVAGLRVLDARAA